LEARPGKDADFEEFLKSALALVRNEPATAAWWAVRFGRSEYGIFDVFPDEIGREAHLGGAVAAALAEQSTNLLTKAPEIHRIKVLADKLPASLPAAGDAKALLLTFKAKAGHAADVEQFLLDAKCLVDQEPKTTAWFALQMDDGAYGIFDAFPDNGGRFVHLTGRVPRELAKHSFSWLGSVPDMDMLQVVAEHVGAPQV
jgi:quinol monooxygenase YgiN